MCSNLVKSCRVIIYALCIDLRAQMLHTKGSFEICTSVNVCEAASNTRLKQFLAAERNIYQKSSKNHLNQKLSNLYMIGFKSVRKFPSDCLSTIHYKPLPMECNCQEQQPHGHRWPIICQTIPIICRTIPILLRVATGRS